MAATAPEAWLVSRICDEFNCTPDVARQLNAVDVFEILDLREFARVKVAVDRAENQKDMPDSPLVEIIGEMHLKRRDLLK